MKRKFLIFLPFLIPLILFTYVFLLPEFLLPYRILRIRDRYYKFKYTRHLNSPKPREREFALLVLANTNRHYAFEPDYEPCLRLLVSDPNADVRASAAQLLGSAAAFPKYAGLKKSEVNIIVEALAKALKNDPNAGVQALAAHSLATIYEYGSIGTKEAIKYLKEVAADESGIRSEAAQMELGFIEKFLRSQQRLSTDE